MAEIILSKLTVDNFKGCRHFVLEPSRRGCTVSGANAAGKTTLFDAYLWLLWGKDSRGRKDFDIKPLAPDGTVADHGAITSVEGEFWADGKPVTLKRTYYEKWSTKRGSSTETFDGHSSDYYIDEVPAQKRAFDQAVADLVGDEETFRVLTSVTWFPEQMKWQDRRAKLFDLAGIRSDRAIMETDDRFRPLLDSMGNKSLEDYRKVLTAQRKGQARAKTDIPARMDEQQLVIRQLEGLDFAGAEGAAEALTAKETELQAKLLRLRETDPAAGFKADREKLEARLAALEAENRAHRIDLQAGQDSRMMLERSIQDAETAIVRQTRDLSRLMEDEKRLQSRIETLRAEWSMTDTREYAGSDVCPTCGQKLPEKKLRQAKAAFDAQKKQDLEKISREGQQAGVELERIQIRIVEQQDQIENLEAEKKARLEELEALPESAPAEDLPGYQEQRTEILAKTEQLDRLIRTAGEPERQAEDKLRAELADVQARRRDQEAILARKVTLTAARQRTEELRQQALKVSETLEELDGMLMLIEEFVRYKAGFVEDSVNALFDKASFRLFREQINGGLEECCDVVYGGVPYGSLNNGARINIGIDIIRTIGTITGVTVPLFVDNAEAVTDLWSSGGQMILLRVAGKDKELKVR